MFLTGAIEDNDTFNKRWNLHTFKRYDPEEIYYTRDSSRFKAMVEAGDEWKTMLPSKRLEVKASQYDWELRARNGPFVLVVSPVNADGSELEFDDAVFFEYHVRNTEELYKNGLIYFL